MTARPTTGLPRSTRPRRDRGGCPLYPGTAVSTRPVELTGRRLPLPSAANPAPRLPHSIAEANFTRHHQGFIRIHPSGLPLTCSRRMARRPLGLNSELHTPPLPVTHVEAGTGIEHSPGTTRSSEPPSGQSSRHVRPRVARSVIGARSPVGFRAVAQGEVGAGVDGVGVVEGAAEFVDGGGVAWRVKRVEPDVQGVVVGDDVAGAGEGGADQGVGFVVGAGVAGVGDDRTGEGSRGVERGDADGVVDQFGCAMSAERSPM